MQADHPITSIKTKLYLSFLAIIGLFLFVDTILGIMHVAIVDEYRKLEDNIILQFQLIDDTSTLIQSYNDYRNTSTSVNLKNYQIAHQKILATFAKIERIIVDEDSKQAFEGVKSTIQNVMAETDDGVDSITRGDIVGTSSHFAEANRKFFYVRENVANLIFKDLAYNKVVQAKVYRTYLLFLWVGIFMLIVTLALCITFSTLLSRKLVLPLINLTKISKIISSGNLDINVDDKLLQSSDEVGILSNSFQTMIKNLKASVVSLAAAKGQLETKNSELENTNKLFINRELKMMELKKRISELEGTTEA